MLSVESSATEILHNQTGIISRGGYSGPLQGIRMGPEVHGMYRSRRANLVEEPEKHSRDVSKLVGEIAAISL